MGRLRIDFYESGVGETIVITFPSGGVGIVDAHPSQGRHRPDISELLAGRKVLFVCLTHPHADHGRDLIPVVEKHPHVDEFWHTIFDIPALIYGVEQTVNFPSPVREFAAKMNRDWGQFLCDLFDAVRERRIPRHLLRSDVREQIVDGVEIHCLGPDEVILNQFFDAYKHKLTNPEVEVPDPNLISAILALKFGRTVVLLGSDALKKNWGSAVRHYRKLGFPKAQVLKVPHHGAKNALSVKEKGDSYLDVCSGEPRVKAILFAGDSKHPNVSVYDRLRSRTDLLCVSNGTRFRHGDLNPLRLQIPGAHVVQPARICNPVISLRLDQDGGVEVMSGNGCEACDVEHRHNSPSSGEARSATST